MELFSGNCRYGGRCRYDHVYPNYPHGSSGGGGGSSPLGGYRGSSSYAGHGSSYGYGGGYSGGGGGGGGGYASDRGGTSILRFKSSGQGQFHQTDNSLFSAAPNHFAPPSSNHYGQKYEWPKQVVHQQRPTRQHELREVLELVREDIIASEQGGQWPLSCYAPLKEDCFPGFEDHSPEEVRWSMYQARQMGKLEECTMKIKVLHDRISMCRQQILNPNRDVIQVIERLARGGKLEVIPVAPLYDMENTPACGFGTVAGSSILNAAPVSSSFTFTLDSKPQPQINRDFSMIGGAQQGTNGFSSSVFGGTAGNVQNFGQSIFGGSSQGVSVMQSVDSPRNGFGGGTNNMSDSTIYTPMEEVTEEMLAAFKAPTFTMGSVPIKPPPRELCN